MNRLSIQSTIYFDPDIHDALRAKAAMTQHTLSEVVNEIMHIAMKENQEDLNTFDERANEPIISYEKLLEDVDTPKASAPGKSAVKKKRNSIKTAPGCGIWKEREDMKDPTEYIQKMRNIRKFR